MLKKLFRRLSEIFHLNEISKDSLPEFRNVIRRHINALGKDAYFRELSAPEILSYNEAVQQRGRREATPLEVLEFGARLLCMSLCNKKGVRLYRDDEYPLLMNLPLPALDEMISYAFEIMGMSKDVIEEAKKNLKNAQAESWLSR